ncbi:MAG: sulfatase [Candidatus Binatia bacterium]|nr:sulfatase [Candidatus Binatia bacterium]
MPILFQRRPRPVYQFVHGGANAVWRRLRRAVAVAGACLLLVSAGAGASDRAIEPEAGSPSMAGVAVVEIGQETRPVLARTRRRALRLNERIVLPVGVLEVPVELPADLDDGVGIKIDATVSLRDPDKSKDVTPRDAQRMRLEPVSVVAESGATSATLSVPIPPEFGGQRGLVTVVARELPGAAVAVEDVGPWKVDAGARLEFGFGVEASAWEEGHPPAHFRVVGLPEGGEPVVLFDRRLDPVRDARDRRWVDASVGLESLAGRTVTFRFEAGSQPDTLGAKVPRSLPVFSNPRLRRARSTEAKRPNVVLVSLDTLRAQSTSAYGYRHRTTPQLDARLAKAGALVKQAVVPVPFTPPSHMTMLTGLEPCAHGIEDRDGILAPEDLLLAEILRDAGYDTAAFTENAYVVAGAGFARGFDAYVEMREDASAAPGFGVATFRAAEEWLAQSSHEPFFLFVHTYQVHQPYTPPRGYRHLFGDYPPEDGREQRWKDDQQAYDQEIRYTDDLLGGFLDVLAARGLVDDTIVIVTSDHGEEFGHHSWGGHGFGLWDEAVLVPLVIRAPGIIAPGTVIDSQVGLVDLVPTVLDLAGVGLPRPVQGQSFAGLLRGTGPGDFEERPLVSRATGFKITAVRMPPVKYVLQEDRETVERLYFLDKDPAEKRPVKKLAHKKELGDGRTALARFDKDCVAYRAAHPVTTGKDSLFEQRPDWLINRNEIDRKLRSLGYVE